MDEPIKAHPFLVSTSISFPNNLNEDEFIKDGFGKYDDFTNSDKVVIFE